MMNGVGRSTGVLDGGRDRRREGAVLRVNLGRLIVTNGDFATRLFPNHFGQDLLDNAYIDSIHIILRLCTMLLPTVLYVNDDEP